MTGFGRAIAEAHFGKVVVEVQSINRKYLEVFVSLPKEFGRFEIEVRKMVSESVQRGQVSVRISVLPNAAAVESTLPDTKVLKALKSGWEEIAQKMGYGKEAVSLPFLAQHASLAAQLRTVEDADFDPMGKCLADALKSLAAMKLKEGAALVKDIRIRLENLERNVLSVERLSPEATAKLRNKLKERMEEIFQPGADLDDRLMREVALFAEKVDISEEITRFRSHLVQYEEILKSKASGTGRKMDFLVQEMGREVNTIGSKSMESTISHLVVEMKSELEKIREQIQNIE